MSDALIDSLEKEHLVTVVRQFQRSTSSGGAASWQNYLDSQKLKRNDPSLCSIAQLRQFIKQALVSPSSAPSELQHADVMNRFVRWVGWKRDVQKAEDGAKEAISSSEGAWGLVKRTRAHHSYAKNYDLQSHMKGWAWIRKRALSEEKPRLIAMDCEMVETDVDKDSLVGFCLVDDQGKVRG